MPDPTSLTPEQLAVVADAKLYDRVVIGSPTRRLLAIIDALDKRVVEAEKHKPIAPPVECWAVVYAAGIDFFDDEDNAYDYAKGMRENGCKEVTVRRGVFLPLEVCDE